MFSCLPCQFDVHVHVIPFLFRLFVVRFIIQMNISQTYNSNISMNYLSSFYKGSLFKKYEGCFQVKVSKQIHFNLSFYSYIESILYIHGRLGLSF